MDVELSKTFRFEAAHWLPMFPEGHKCRRLHGHSFLVNVVLKGAIEPATGILMDYGDIKSLVSPLIDRLDHHCLNHLGEAWQEPLLSNPTAEHLAIWLHRQIKPLLPVLDRIELHETCTSSCIYRG
jgi:6-pyruvoyltetrahydropterin/6-carboxytetrahydropterin synthase